MGFEDDFDYNNNFETDVADLSSDNFSDKPKKFSRKELREAKKKNAEKTADLPKQKKGFFNRRERLDDDDSLNGEHLFDPTRSTMVSTPHDHKYDYETTGPIRNTNSEFSYLFDPVDDDETEDDVYPDESIYSDGEAARDMLAGLSYDEERDGESSEFDKYFDEHATVRPPSKFSFKKRKEQESDLGDLSDTEDDRPRKVTPQPVFKSDDDNDSFLPELRPDSVFMPKNSQQSVSQSEPRISAEEQKTEESEEDDMPQDTEDFHQDFIPYSNAGMYPTYPIQPMNQMMGYPVVIPNGNQVQGGVPYQTIPIPYPMPMPMPMPMYPQGYYPPYAPYPQYPPYPPYAAPDYGRYSPSEYDDKYDGRRSSRYDDRRESRREARYKDNSERHVRHYDDERENAGESQHYDDRRESERSTYPQPPYQPPYQSSEYNRGYESAYNEEKHINVPTAREPEVSPSHNEPIYTPQTAYEPIQQTAVPQPVSTPELTPSQTQFNSLDFTFNRPASDTDKKTETSAFDNDFDLNGFENDLLDDNSADLGFGGNENSDSDFKLGFENPAVQDNAFEASHVDEVKPKGGRFKKRR